MIMNIMYHKEIDISIRHRICACGGDDIYGPYPKLEIIKFTCSICFKPRIEHAHQCVDCGIFFVQHGDTKFKHPQFCRLNPRCWNCCEAIDPETPVADCCEFCAMSLREIPLQRDNIRRPPIRLPLKPGERFDLFKR